MSIIRKTRLKSLRGNGLQDFNWNIKTLHITLSSHNLIPALKTHRRQMHLCFGIQETIYLLFHYASLHSGKEKWTICGVLRRYVSQNIVAITGNLRLNRFTCFMYLIDRFSQLWRCEVVLDFINTWDIKYPLSRNFLVSTCVKFAFANKIEAMYERPHVQLCKRKSRNSLNLTFNLNTLYLTSILFTWLKFTCVNVRSQKRVSGNPP